MGCEDISFLPAIVMELLIVGDYHRDNHEGWMVDVCGASYVLPRY